MKKLLAEAKRRFKQRIADLRYMADWKESLETRLETAQELLEAGLPHPGFDALVAEIRAYSTRCVRIGQKRANGT